MKEIWRDIKGFEGLYQISSYGRVKSICYKNKHRILREISDGSNYLQVCLFKNKTRKTIRIHKLMAIVFLNHKPNGHKIVVDHIDKNTINNNINNLRLITQRQNTAYPNVKKTSKYRGVYAKDNKWAASIHINGKSKHLGTFNSEIDASNAYNIALSSHSMNY